MSTITKEQAKDLRNAFECWQQDYDPVEDKEQYDMFGLGVVAMDALLASLEAEAVAYIIQDSDARGRGEKGILRYFANISDEDINEYEITVTPLYAAPPAPVSVPDYPETLPCPVMLEPGLRFGKGVKTHTVLEALKRRAEYYAELEVMTPEQRVEHDAGMKEFAAMLQGAELVSNRDELPDGWVACSERMPETMVSVLVTGTWFHHAVAFWDGLSWCDLDFEPPVTHWMPLPAAPQQEVKP